MSTSLHLVSTKLSTVLTTVVSFVYEVIQLIVDLFAAHKCNLENVKCEGYSDEQQFLQWKEKSELSTYADEVIASGVLGRKLRCDICGHDRGVHGRLSSLRLTPDMLPNGGLVHMKLVTDAENERKRRRFQRLNGESEESNCLQQQNKSTTIVDKGIKIEEDHDVMKMNENVRRVCNGDKISIQYKVFESNNKQNVNVDEEDKMNMTVGARNVIEGLDIGVLGMRQGRMRKITVPASLAYGKNDMVFHVRLDHFLT